MSPIDYPGVLGSMLCCVWFALMPCLCFMSSLLMKLRFNFACRSFCSWVSSALVLVMAPMESRSLGLAPLSCLLASSWPAMRLSIAFSASRSSLSRTYRCAGDDDLTASTKTHFTGAKYLFDLSFPLGRPPLPLDAMLPRPSVLVSRIRASEPRESTCI